MKYSRILAKVIDYSWFYTALYACGFPFLINITLFLLLPLLFAPFEALMHSAFKTTPGKYIFGLSLSERLPILSSLKFSLKKSLLILPLLFAPLNIFFAWFYLKESKEHQDKRWSQFNNVEITSMKKKRHFKYILAFALVLGVSYTYLPSNFKTELLSISKQELDLKNWVEVKDSNLKFSVYFPSKPKIEKKEIEVEEHDTTLDVTEYTHTAGISYSLQSSKIPSSWTFFGSKYLFKSLAKPLEEHQGKIIDKKILKHGSHPAMEYLLNNKEGGQTKGTMVLVKKTIYKLEVTSKETLTDIDKQHAQNFIESFDIN